MEHKVKLGNSPVMDNLISVLRQKNYLPKELPPNRQSIITYRTWYAVLIDMNFSLESGDLFLSGCLHQTKKPGKTS
jgi:hypothetical protein